MSHDAGDRGDFLSRWSRRKTAARTGVQPAQVPPAPAMPASVSAESSPTSQPEPPAPLPPVESLTPESDFTPFMRTDVDPGLRQQALRTLFRDPRFNVMDGLDVYIDDYSKPDPIPAEWLGKLNQMARLGDYRPPEAEAPPPEQVTTEAEPAQITDQEQQVAEPIANAPADTSADALPPSELKQS
jgi:hypothetical protein